MPGTSEAVAGLVASPVKFCVVKQLVLQRLFSCCIGRDECGVYCVSMFMLLAAMSCSVGHAQNGVCSRMMIQKTRLSWKSHISLRLHHVEITGGHAFKRYDADMFV